jgi:hypothetical protein
MEAKMPGDPKECRERARNCRLLAEEASDAQSKQTFLDLALGSRPNWKMLLHFLNALKEMEFEDASENIVSDEDQHEAA